MELGIAAMAGEVYFQHIHPVSPSDLFSISSDVTSNVSMLLLVCRISTSKAFPFLPGVVLLLLLLIKPWPSFQRELSFFWSGDQPVLLPSYLAMRIVASIFNSIVFELTDFGKLVLDVESMGASISLSAKKLKLPDNGEETVMQANASLIAVLRFTAVVVSFSVLWTVVRFLSGLLLVI
jgi:hypothetical protein